MEEQEWPQKMTFVTTCPNCGDLTYGHKPGCSNPMSCVEYVWVVPEAQVSGLEVALEEAVVAGQTLALHTQGRSENRDVAEAKERLERARTALASLKAGKS
jgi:hypothetical protein